MGNRAGMAKRQTTAGNFPSVFFLAFCLSPPTSIFLFFSHVFFFALPEGVSRPAGAVLAAKHTARPTFSPRLPWIFMQKHTHTHTCAHPHIWTCCCSLPVSLLKSCSPGCPGSLVFPYCWLRYAKCALMHFTTLYGSLPGGRNYGKLMRIYICDLAPRWCESFCSLCHWKYNRNFHFNILILVLLYIYTRIRSFTIFKWNKG